MTTAVPQQPVAPVRTADQPLSRLLFRGLRLEDVGLDEKVDEQTHEDEALEDLQNCKEARAVAVQVERCATLHTDDRASRAQLATHVLNLQLPVGYLR